MLVRRQTWVIFFSEKHYYFICMSCMYVPVKARRGHQIPRNWSYRWLWMAMWGLAIEPRPLVRAARDLNCWAISAIIWVMLWFEFKIGLKAAERRYLAQDLLMNVQRGVVQGDKLMAGWGHSLQLTLYKQIKKVLVWAVDFSYCARQQHPFLSWIVISAKNRTG